MTTYATVNQVKRALDAFLRTEGYSGDGGHYLRPNGTKGPMVRYGDKTVGLVFAVDRTEDGGWTASGAWLRVGKDAVEADLLLGFGIWERGVA